MLGFSGWLASVCCTQQTGVHEMVVEALLVIYLFYLGSELILIDITESFQSSTYLVRYSWFLPSYSVRACESPLKRRLCATETSFPTPPQPHRFSPPSASTPIRQADSWQPTPSILYSSHTSTPEAISQRLCLPSTSKPPSNHPSAARKPSHTP